MELLRMLVVVVVGLVGLIGQTTAWAGAMLPRYRVEDLGPADKFLGTTPILFPDGTVDNYTNPSNKEYWRRGDYTFSRVYQGGGNLIGYTFKKEGSDVNLMANVDASDTYVRNINAIGQYLAYDGGNNSDSRDYVFDTGTGTKTYLETTGLNSDLQKAIGINSAGNLVGYALFPGGIREATFYQSATTEAILLNTLVDGASNWLLKTAGGINDAGEIVGIGSDLNKPTHGGRAYKLVPITPVPEPSSLLIGSLGIAAATWKFRKRRNSIQN